MKKKEDRTDPVCGMPGKHYAHGHWFCSLHCIKKYEKQHNLAHASCPSCQASNTKWWQERLFIVSAITGVIILISYLIPFLNPLFSAFMDYLGMLWWAILLGLFIGGLIDRFIPREFISKHLSEHKKSTIFNAVILGFLMSACSHGILAISIELYKKGASIPAIIAFLLASPWANLPVTLMLIAFFGLKALFLILGAILIAVITGLIYQGLDKRDWIEQTPKAKHEKDFSLLKDLKQRFKAAKFNAKEEALGVLAGSWALAKMVLWWIMIGMVLASVSRAFVPTAFFHQYLGASLLGLFLTLVIATIIEVCSEGSAPLAFEIFKQTGAFGNGFVFLLAGVATDYTEIGLLWSNIGRKTALWLPVVTVPQVLLLGWVFNLVL